MSNTSIILQIFELLLRAEIVYLQIINQLHTKFRILELLLYTISFMYYLLFYKQNFLRGKSDTVYLLMKTN